MFGKLNNKASGFSLLEIMVAVLIIGLLATVVVPNLWRRQPKYEREQFIGRLNSLMQYLATNAITTGKIHRIDFDFNKAQIRSFIAGPTQGKKEQQFNPLTQSYVATTMSIPDSLSIKQFYIEGFDEMKRRSKGKTNEVYFYIVPEGLTQAVIINLLDTKDLVADKPRQVGLVLNQFTAQFKVYDEFKKP